LNIEHLEAAIDLICGVITGLVFLSLAGLAMDLKEEFKSYRNKGFNKRLAFKLVFRKIFY